MLSGCTPWEEAPIDQFCRKLMSKTYLKFRKEHWDEVSEEAIDLVKRLLERDVSKRILGEEAIAHAWVLQGKEETRRLGLATPEHSKGAGAEDSALGFAAAAAESPSKRPLSKGYGARLRHLSVNRRSRKRAKRPVVALNQT